MASTARHCLPRLEERHGELLAAIAWFLDERQPNGAMRIANALARFWTATGRLEEGSQWFGHILAAANGSEAYFGRACSEAGLVESGGATMSGPLHFTVERLRLADGAAMRPYPRSA